MKRNLCAKHANYLMDKTKPIQLTDEEHCTICRWEKRPYTLGDLARLAEEVAWGMRHAQDCPSYDPFGFSYGPNMEKLILEWVKSINQPYKSQLMDVINKAYKESKNGA